MMRMATGLCVAAALSVVTLGAQTTPPATSGQRTASADAAKEVTLTGCLSKGADGKFILNNAKMDNPSATAGTSGTATPPAGSTAGTAGSAAMNTAASWALSGGTDLEKHVGHQIQVTGKSSMNPAMDHGRTPDTTAAAAGGTATGATASGATAAGTVGTSGSTATAATEEQRKDTKTNQPRLDVQSVKMIAATCS
jgi:hypothetical protein